MNKQATRDKFGMNKSRFGVAPTIFLHQTGKSRIDGCTNDSILGIRSLTSLRTRKHLFVAAHGNSLRSIIMHLEGLSKEEVLGLEVPTGVPMMYELKNGVWKRTMG